jgi:hypothetical protein
MHEESADPRVRFETMYWIDCTVCGPDADPPPPRYSTEAGLWTTLLGASDSGWIKRDDGRILLARSLSVDMCGRPWGLNGGTEP